MILEFLRQMILFISLCGGVYSIVIIDKMLKEADEEC